MNSYEFEVAAKQAVIRMLVDNDIMVTIRDLQLVWFTHVVGNKKCMIFCPEVDNIYAEVTFVKDSGMMYVDLYEKIAHDEVAAG